MSAASELPPLVLAPLLCAGGGPLLVQAVRHFARVVPAARVGPARWRATDVLLVSGWVLVALFAAPALVRLESTLALLLASQAVLASGGLLACVLARRRTGGLATLGFLRPSAGRAYPAALLGYGALWLCYSGVLVAWSHLSRALGWQEQQELLQLLFELGGAELVLFALLAIVVGPFLEELLFRGFLQSALGELVGLRTGALVSALLFALLHGLPGLPGLVLLSVYLTWLRLRGGSLFVPYLVHALHNALTIGLALALRGVIQ